MNEQALDYKMQGFAMMGVEKFDKAVELFSKSIEIKAAFCAGTGTSKFHMRI